MRVLGSAGELWRYYVGIIACSVGVAATGLAIPFIIARATDYVVSALGTHRTDVGPVIVLAAALLAVDLASTLVSNWGGYLGDVMAVRLRGIMSQRYYAKLLSLPQRYFDNELTGTIINRLTRSITEVTGFFNAFANNFFPMLLTVGAVLVITAFYSWPLTVLLAVIYPLFMWLTARTSRRWQRLEGHKNRLLDAAGGRFAEVVGQIRVVKSFGQELRELEGFAAKFTGTADLTREQSRYWHQMDVARRAVLNVIFFAIFALIFSGAVRGTFSVGSMVLLIQLVNLARQPVFSMSYLVDFSQRALAGSRDYFAVLDLPVDETAPALIPDAVATRPLAAAAGGGAAASPLSAGQTPHSPAERGSSARATATTRTPPHPHGPAARTPAAGLGTPDPAMQAVSQTMAAQHSHTVHMPGSPDGAGRTPSGTEVPDSPATGTARTARLDSGSEVPGGAATGTEWSVGFDQVTFSYAPGERVLDEVSFTVPAGSKVALVGESGGGKTTIASLLLRLYSPDAGRIAIAGHDIAAMPVEQVRESIAMVFQAPSLFSGTIAENISYARPHASAEEIERAAHLAGAHEFIARYADGYETTIGERGVKLSGGQQQRVAVARAILKDAPILVLDEATSSLDGKSERAVQRGLDHLMQGRTTLVIAHRLSTIAGVDLIVTLREGRVDEIGSPDELATSGGVYSELLALQASDSKRDRRRLAREFDIVR